jgi:two-component system chemotaxis response regulator CheB
MSVWTPVKRFTERSSEEPGGQLGYSVVVIGTSWGGLAAVRELFGTIPPEYDIPTVLVQHRHRDSDALLARFLQDFTSLAVCEAEDKQPLQAGRVFVAPSNYHTLVEAGHLALSVDAPVHHSRPSIDVTMTSAADSYGHRAVGVVLTGANDDGTRGLRRIADVGGMAVVQDPQSAESSTMPRAALDAVPTARVFTLARLAQFLGELPSKYRGAA